ncbi:MAG: CinA family nicotinamide mononucleotide deamidase-related protein [Bacilli bacterium]|jgi:nicotinamide-nucleotide amidase|nr:CinA family nicotinamide mononucleotide deamidase-related protein [Bacilli bacterium]MDY0208908.1 CinA family nicotinamide mononucleotide deamidase-related protein [Bacilli bacterium]
MKAIILNVGNEVLEGRVINTNGAFLSTNLLKLGITPTRITTIGDDYFALQTEVKTFLTSDNDILITTGGLGPTHDDFTKEVLFATLGLEMVIHDQAKALLDDYFGEKYAQCNLKQAYFPKEAIIIANKLGTADGCIVEKDNKIFIVLVGPPFEMNPMVIDTVIPYLSSKTTNQMLIKEYIVMGLGESTIEELLQPLYHEYSLVSIAPYASLGKIRYQITANLTNQEQFTDACIAFTRLLADSIISSENEEIEEKVVQELRRLHWKISFSESCTGGMLAAKIVNVSGASDVFSESLITYSNQAKSKYLHVSSKTLANFGAVSEETVREMVLGLSALTQSEVCIAVSGIAGPSGGTPTKPVGLVYYAIKINDEIIINHYLFKGGREQIRTRACLRILFDTYQKIKAV